MWVRVSLAAKTGLFVVLRMHASAWLQQHGIGLWLQDESRWEREVSRLQQITAADLQRVRQEANEAAEREARLLRWGMPVIRGPCWATARALLLCWP